MNLSQTNTLNFSIPPEDFDAKHATEITQTYRRIINQLLKGKENSLTLSPSVTEDVRTMLELMDAAYIQLTYQYFQTIRELESLKKSQLKFRIEKCEDEYLEEDFALLAEKFKGQIVQTRSEELKELEKEFNDYKPEDFDPSSFEIVLVEVTHPTTIQSTNEFYKGFHEAFDYILFEGFGHKFLLSCLSALGKKEIINEHTILMLYDEYNSAKKLKILIDEIVKDGKSFSDHFFGNIHERDTGLSGMEDVAVKFGLLAERVEMLGQKDKLFEKIISLIGGRKIYFFILKKDFLKVNELIAIAECKNSLAFLLESRKVQTGL